VSGVGDRVGPELDTGLIGARAASMLSLLTSGSTLMCCALPALLVAVGAGAVLASAVTAFPALVWPSEYKALVFGGSGLMLGVAGMMQWQARSLPCPVDPAQAAACARLTPTCWYASSFGTILPR